MGYTPDDCKEKDVAEERLRNRNLSAAVVEHATTEKKKGAVSLFSVHFFIIAAVKSDNIITESKIDSHLT